VGELSEFFFLQVLDREGAPVAYGTDDPERDQLLAEPGHVDNWPELKLAVHGGQPTDYLANNVGARLCSVLLRDLLDQRRSSDDEVQWLDVEVVDQIGTKHNYYLLHLVSHPDVLDPQRTIRARGEFVVKPVLSRARVGNHRVLSFPGATTRLIVADDVKRAIEGAACTGVDFEAVASV
jgi:Immunity protein family (Imm11)